MSCLFNSFDPYFKQPFGAVRAGQTVRLSLCIPEELGYVDPHLVLKKEGKFDVPVYYRMNFDGQTPRQNHFSVEVPLNDPGLYFYYFDLYTDFRRIVRGPDNCGVISWQDGESWQITVYEQDFETPESIKGKVFYQIFPDRFCEGVENKPMPFADRIYQADKHAEPFWQPNEVGGHLNEDYFGGDLKGIQQKLPYLHEMGVDFIYLNPIFEAHSNHRYNTADYLNVDPLLGTNEDFEALCTAAQKYGIGIVLDGVFSHVGSRSAYFQQAIHDPSSPYRGWFRFQHYPDVYDSWWGITTLPCVDKMNPDFIRYMIDDEDSVAVHWLKLGADGWRLDVVDELPDAFLARLRARIRAYKPDALLIGEVWEDASNKIAYDQRRRYFTDRQLDSVMNYPWQKAILRYVRSEDDGTVLGDAIRTLAENYPPDVLQTVMNILSTHDTPRAINAILDPRDGDRTDLAQRHFTQEQLREGRQRLKLAAFLQFMLPGMPCIYYGDEAGMTGYRDPFNRKFYPWGREDGNLVSFYRSLARVKKSAPALRSGTVLVLEAGGGRLLLLRQSAEGSVAVCCNQSPEPWTLPHSGTILLGGGIMEYTGETVTLGQGGFCAMERK